MSLVSNNQSNIQNNIIDFSIYNITCEKCDKIMLNTQYAEHILNCSTVEIPIALSHTLYSDIIKNSYDYDKIICNLQIDKSLSNHNSSSNIYSDTNIGNIIPIDNIDDDIEIDNDIENNNNNDNNDNNIDPLWISWIYRYNRNIYNYIFDNSISSNSISSNSTSTNRDNIFDNTENDIHNRNIGCNMLNSIDIIDVELLTVSKDVIECPVCLEKTNNNCELICKHLICYECAKNWFKLKNSCPLCRKIIS